MRRDFNAFVRACEKYGRAALADIARDVENKSEEEVGGWLWMGGVGRPGRVGGWQYPSAVCECGWCFGAVSLTARAEPLPDPCPLPSQRARLTPLLPTACLLLQVRAYAKVFWERYTEINDHEKVRCACRARCVALCKRFAKPAHIPAAARICALPASCSAAAALPADLPASLCCSYLLIARMAFLPSWTPPPPPGYCLQYIKNIERGEQRIQRQQDIMQAIATKLEKYKNPWQVRYRQGGTGRYRRYKVPADQLPGAFPAQLLQAKQSPHPPRASCDDSLPACPSACPGPACLPCLPAGAEDPVRPRQGQGLHRGGGSLPGEQLMLQELALPACLPACVPAWVVIGGYARPPHHIKPLNTPPMPLPLPLRLSASTPPPPYRSLSLPACPSAPACLQVCMMHKLGYGAWDELKAEIRNHWRFRFDWFFKSRTPQVGGAGGWGWWLGGELGIGRGGVRRPGQLLQGLTGAGSPESQLLPCASSLV